jgi:hypothetical protein
MQVFQGGWRLAVRICPHAGALISIEDLTKAAIKWRSTVRNNGQAFSHVLLRVSLAYNAGHNTLFDAGAARMPHLIYLILAISDFIVLTSLK